LRNGWRATIVLATVSTVLVAVLFVLATRQAQTEAKNTDTEERITEQLSTVLGRMQTLATTAMMTLVEFVGVASMAFIPVILLEAHDLSAMSANLLFALFFAVGAVSQPAVGWLSDRYGRDRTIVGLAAAGVVGYGGLTVEASTPLTGAAIVLAGTAMSSTPVIQSRMLDGLSAADRGAGFGAFRTVYLLLGASGTVVIGTLADVSGWTVATGLMGFCFLVILVLAVAGASNDAQ
jgi:predicted MFS family arabinose efflux permease